MIKRLLLLGIACVFLTSCSVTSLYYWGGVQDGTTAYENLAYLSYDKQTPESLCDLICVYEDMVNNPIGTRQVPPPGICAEYGYLLLKPETATQFAQSATDRQRSIFKRSDYETFFQERGEEMLLLEMEYYPESIVFIKPLFKKLTDSER